MPWPRRSLALLAIVPFALLAVWSALAQDKPANSPKLAQATVAASAASAVAAAKAPAPKRTHIGSVRFRTWVWPTPARGKDYIALGALRIGTKVKLLSSKSVNGRNWYPIEPYGYVYADHTTTFDFESVYWKALSSLTPKPGPWPYRYAFSTGAPAYTRIPTKAEEKAAERLLGPTRKFTPLGEWSRSHEVLLRNGTTPPIKATEPRPDFFKGNKAVPGSPWNSANPKLKMIPAGTGLAYAKAFKAQGRVWLLTPDMLLVPADRMFAWERSKFKGIELKGNKSLPLAWVKAKKAPKLLRSADGKSFSKSGKSWPNKTYALLSTERAKVGKRTFYRRSRETDASGNHYWLREDKKVGIVDPVKKLRFGIKSTDRWLLASIMNGTMVAYKGLKPLFTTMWSGGKGGLPVKGLDPRIAHTTEVGVFPIQWKDNVSTMSKDKGAPTVFWMADVPHVQYVKMPLALHVSPWHDNFGNLMSAECLNVSAADGKWLFDFTLPKMPKGWNSIRPHKATSGWSTKVRITP